MDTLKQVRMHKKAGVVKRLLWAARSAAEHNYSLDPENLYIGNCLSFGKLFIIIPFIIIFFSIKKTKFLLQRVDVSREELSFMQEGEQVEK